MRKVPGSQFLRNRIITDLAGKRRTEPVTTKAGQLKASLCRSIRQRSEENSLNPLNRRYESQGVRCRGSSLNFKEGRKKNQNAAISLEDLLHNSELLHRLRREIQLTPSPQALLLLGQYQFRTRNPGQALLTVTRVLTDQPDHQQALRLRASIYRNLGRSREAFADLEHLHRLNGCEDYLLEMLEIDSGCLDELLDRSPSEKVVRQAARLLLERGMMDAFLRLAGRVRGSSYVSFAKAEVLEQQGLPSQRQLCLE